MADVDTFCPHPVTISAILSYCGSALDVGINYLLLVINLVGCGAVHRRLRSISIAGASRGSNSSSSACFQRSPSLGSTLLSLSFVIAFQIVLCLFVGCVGISIIWSAILGWMVLEFIATLKADGTCTVHVPARNGTSSEPDRPGPRETLSSSPTAGGTFLGACCRRRIFRVPHVAAGAAVLLDLFAIMYYAITAPAITTVAHLLAILMGMILEVVARQFSSKDSCSSAESSTTPLLSGR